MAYAEDLKSSAPKGRVGSTPTVGTNHKQFKNVTFLLALIALPGIAAVLIRWSRSVFVTARHTIEWFVAGQIADQRAQRGDISGMSEAVTIRTRSRGALLSGVLRVLLYSAAIVIPMFLPGTFLIYTLYGFLWFV